MANGRKDWNVNFEMDINTALHVDLRSQTPQLRRGKIIKEQNKLSLREPRSISFCIG